MYFGFFSFRRFTSWGIEWLVKYNTIEAEGRNEALRYKYLNELRSQKWWKEMPFYQMPFYVTWTIPFHVTTPFTPQIHRANLSRCVQLVIYANLNIHIHRCYRSFDSFLLCFVCFYMRHLYAMQVVYQNAVSPICIVNSVSNRTPPPIRSYLYSFLSVTIPRN